MVYIEEQTYRDLDIFNEIIHPSIVTEKGKSKEGVSVFSMLNNTFSSVGYYSLRELMQFPTHNIDLLNERYDRIEQMIGFIE